MSFGTSWSRKEVFQMLDFISKILADIIAGVLLSIIIRMMTNKDD